MVAKVKLGIITFLALLVISLLLSNNAAPDFGPFFGLKRLQENLFLKIKTSPIQKVDYESAILDERLSELKYLVENRKIGYFLTASLRYSATAGRLTDIISQNNISDKVFAAKAKFTQHQKIIEGLVTLCQKNDNTECKYIQDDANYLKIYISNLSSIK